MRHARHQRREAPLLLRLRRRQRERAHRAPMKRTQKRDDVLPACVIARELHRALNRLCAGVAIEKRCGPGIGATAESRLASSVSVLVIEICSGDVNQLRRLLLDRRHNFGMTMPRRNHGDARRKIQKLVPVHVFHANTAPALRHQRIRPRIAGRNQPRHRPPQPPAPSVPEAAHQLRSVLRMQFASSSS